MANNVNARTLVSGPTVTVLHHVIEYVDTAVTDYLLYDSSAEATTAGVTDTLDCKIDEIEAVVVAKNATAAALPQVKLEFDATTDVLATALAPNIKTKLCFKHVGGLRNNAGTGKTGDILLTATNLAAGDLISVLMKVTRV